MIIVVGFWSSIWRTLINLGSKEKEEIHVRGRHILKVKSIPKFDKRFTSFGDVPSELLSAGWLASLERRLGRINRFLCGFLDISVQRTPLAAKTTYNNAVSVTINQQFKTKI